MCGYVESKSKSDQLVLDFGAGEDLNWLLSSLYGWNGNSLKVKNQIHIVTDASPSGYGAT